MLSLPKRLVFWTNILSHHQIPWIEHLRTDFGFETEYVVTSQEDAKERVAQGWPSIEVGSKVHFRPTSAEVESMIAERKGESLHLITGGFSWPTSRFALNQSLKLNASFGILAEPPFPYAKFYGVKRLAQRIFRIARGRQVSGVWAIGGLAVNFYQSIGYESRKVIEWGYFPPIPEPGRDREVNEKFKIFYVGQFNERKGVDVLAESLSSLNIGGWEATLIGGGPNAEQLARQSIPNTRILPFKPYREAMLAIAGADLVVVPSRHDGWGAVVNESLSYGVPVICTDQCGSKVIVSKDMLGQVVKAGDVQAMKGALESAIHQGPICDDRRRSIRTWADDHFSPKVAARYFVETLEALQAGKNLPAPPWRG